MQPCVTVTAQVQDFASSERRLNPTYWKDKRAAERSEAGDSTPDASGWFRGNVMPLPPAPPPPPPPDMAEPTKEEHDCEECAELEKPFKTACEEAIEAGRFRV